MFAHLKALYYRYKKILPAFYFVIGFIWDSLTLQRIDHFYSNFVLSSYIIWLMVSLYIFNLSADGRWKNTFVEKFEPYALFAVQFFFGSSVSAYIIFFFRSVSISKTMVFLILLVFLYIANELFKHRISNKYLQFGAFFFITFIYFEFTIPVFTGTMSTFIFIVAGCVALGLTLFFVNVIYWKSPSTRREISLSKLLAVIICLYVFINTCYYFNIIPPVPLALKTGIVAYNVQKKQNTYIVTYDPDRTYKFWRKYNPTVAYSPGDTIFAYTSIFAPTDLEESVANRWEWYNPRTHRWKTSDTIKYKVTGGRGRGYRGYTYKTNLHYGHWKIDVITDEGLILGTLKFTLKRKASAHENQLIHKKFR
ncbi:MAG TPA: DUF2914 domain-containing protein [Balneolaceae bacterium]|nr:DUF2914 domain-containing protein [Balneolaceae bacterium]